jgi:hypothetical protein
MVFPASKKKVFFFEKKKQKTFAFAPSQPSVPSVRLARNPTDKVFWFFFRKTTVFLLRSGVPRLKDDLLKPRRPGVLDIFQRQRYVIAVFVTHRSNPAPKECP